MHERVNISNTIKFMDQLNVRILKFRSTEALTWNLIARNSSHDVDSRYMQSLPLVIYQVLLAKAFLLDLGYF